MDDHHRQEDGPAPETGAPEPPLAEHETTAVETVARLRADHDETATPLHRAVDAITGLLGRPSAAAGLVLAVAGWVAAIAWRSEGRLDEPMAKWLELAATLAALLLAVLIFASQRRSEHLAERRAELTLQLALLADAKNARIIKLLQAFRHDLPDIADKPDAEADDMATPVDADAVLDAMDRLSPETNT